MGKTKKIDSKYILNENINKVLFKVAGPLMINNIIITLYNLADGLYVARLSSTQFAATSFTWPVQYLFIAFCLGVSIAGTALIARYIGAKRRKDANIYASHVIFILIIMGLAFSLIGFLITPFVISKMGGEGDLYKYSVIYLRINFIGVFFDAIYLSFQSILNAQGKTKETTIIGGISGIINIILDPFLIFETLPILGIRGLGLEIGGAAIATVISKVFSIIMGIIVIRKKSEEVDVSLKEFKFVPNIGKNILKGGIPTALGQSGAALGFTIMNSLIVSYGEDTVAGFSMVNRIGDVFLQPIAGIASAITSIISQNLGAGNIERGKKTYYQAVKFTLLMSVAAAFLIKVFDDELISIFIGRSAGPNVVSEAKEYISYDVFILVLMGGFNTFTGVFQGTGYMRYSMYMSIFRLWVVRIPLLLIFRELTNLGSTGIWISMLVSNLLVNIFAYLLYRNIDWQRASRIES